MHVLTTARRADGTQSGSDRAFLVFGDVALTYRQLQERVDALAKRLANIGTEPERLVGVFMNRSEYMVVAMLAVLKAGGAYVPLDTSHPRQRFALIIEDCRTMRFSLPCR